METRGAEEQEIERLAEIWYQGWQDAHGAILPAELARLRTVESFANRLRAARERVRVAGPLGAPLGFYILKHDELDQFFVGAQVRGTGLAAALLADAEARLAASGVKMAWLACAIGNDRAARFYEKNGWQLAGDMVHHAETANGPFAMEVWRYEKPLMIPA